MKKNIDELFREKMSKSKITAPTESWPIIEAKLKRKKNIRFGYMFSLLGAISLVSFMLFSTHTETLPTKPLQKNTSLKKDVKSKDNEVNEIDINHDKYVPRGLESAIGDLQEWLSLGRVSTQTCKQITYHSNTI